MKAGLQKPVMIDKMEMLNEQWFVYSLIKQLW